MRGKRNGSRAIAAGLGAVATLAMAIAAQAAPTAADLAAALGGDLSIDLIVYPAEKRPGPRPQVTVATLVKAARGAVDAVIGNPAAYRQALPSLVRAETVATRGGSPAAPASTASAASASAASASSASSRPKSASVTADGAERLIAWELEIPLFNLSGRAWLRPIAATTNGETGFELTLVDGAFAPGVLRLRTAPITANLTVLSCEVQLDHRASNWLHRRVARHDPWAETAMTTAAAVVLARAVAARAEAGSSAVRRPSAAIAAPPANALQGAPLGGDSLAPLRRTGVVGEIHRRPDGRLAWTAVAVPLAGDAAAVTSRIAEPETLRLFPGWKRVNRVGSRPLPAAERGSFDVDVNDDIPFVDFDARWRVTTSPVRATAVSGSTKGAVFGWDVLPGNRAGETLSVLSLHPRLDAAGFVERRLIAAEPFLEHGLAAALTYVYAASVRANLAR